MHDVLVIGAGPAGLAVAAQLGQRGLDAVVVAPDTDASWPATYGAWADDLDALGLGQLATRRWARPLVTTQRGVRAVERVYARIDGVGLRERLLRNVPTRVAGRVDQARADGITLAGGRQLRASVVIDASGAGSALRRRTAAATAWQIAYGLDVEVDAHPWADDELAFMDLRADHLAGDEARTPTFLYALPSGPRRVLVEETVLAVRPPVAPEALRDRLTRRLARLGIVVRRVHGIELVRIPLDAPLPEPGDVVAFGASAALVHPISGYMVTRALGLAPLVADAIAHALGQGDATAARRAAWSVVRPAGLEGRHALWMLGLDTLLGLDADGLQGFFDAFFDLPLRHQRAWLDPAAGRAELLAAMASMFGSARSEVRSHVLHRALGSGRAHLFRALTAPPWRI